MRRLTRILFTVCALGAIGVAQAIPVSINFEGSVDFADPGNVFGLGAGDSITGSAFVPNASGAGPETFTPDAGGLEVFFSVGTFDFSTDQDVGFPFSPELLLNDGLLQSLAFVPLESGVFFASLHELFPTWFAFGPDGLGAQGTLTFSTVAVPEPATLALLVIGLLALWVASRKHGRLPGVTRQN